MPRRRSFHSGKVGSGGSDHLPQPPHRQRHDPCSQTNPTQVSLVNFSSPPAATPQSLHCMAHNTQDCSKAVQMIQIRHRLWHYGSYCPHYPVSTPEEHHTDQTSRSDTPRSLLLPGTLQPSAKTCSANPDPAYCTDKFCQRGPRRIPCRPWPTPLPVSAIRSVEDGHALSLVH